MGPDLSLENQKILTETFVKAGVVIGSSDDIHTQLAGMISPLSSGSTTSEVANTLRNRTGAFMMGGPPPPTP